MGYQARVQALVLCMVLAQEPAVSVLSPVLRVYGGVDDDSGFGINTWKLFMKTKMFEKDKTSTLKVGEGVVVTCPKEYRCTTLSPVVCVTPKCDNKQSVGERDSGGPLVYGGKVVGVACGIAYEIKLQFWVSISPYIKWIRDTIAKTIELNLIYKDMTLRA